MRASSAAIAFRQTYRQEAAANIFAAMGLKSLVIDRLANVMSGQGTSIDRRSATTYLMDLMTPEQAEAGYRTDWLIQKIVNIPALDMTREWRSWQAKDTDIELLEDEEKRLELKAKCKRALILARLYGGSALLVGTGDSDPTQELNVEKIGKEGLRYLRVMARSQLTVGPQRLDPEDPFVDRPEYFQINAGVGREIKIHPSRVVEFIGQPAPEGSIYKHDGWFWGDPIMQSIGGAVRNAGLAQDGFAALIDEAKLDIIKMPDLTDIASTTEGEQKVSNRLSMTMLGKSTWRALLLDKEDEWEQRQVTWAGIPDVMMTFLECVAGAADIPVTRMLGQSPKGLQSTGSGEERDYHSMVRAQQEEKLAPALDRIDDLLIRSALGSRPKDIYYEFAPLSELGEGEAAAVDKQTADTLKVYGDTGLIHEEALAEIARNKMIETGRWPGCETAFANVDNALAEGPSPEEQQLALKAANTNEVTKLEQAGKISAATADAARERLALEEDLKKNSLTDYNPNEPRLPKGNQRAGRWTKVGGGLGEALGGEAAGVQLLTEEAKDEMALANLGKSVDQLRLEAATNQHALAKLGKGISTGLNVTFAEPPFGHEVKSAESILRKVADENYSGPHNLRDISRATFVIDNPTQGEAVLGGLAARGKIFDRGWLKEKRTGYVARFVYLQHPGGGVSEVQLVPNGIAQIKMGANLQSNGPGHVLYDIVRNPALPMSARDAAARKSRTLYSRAIPKAFYGIGE